MSHTVPFVTNPTTVTAIRLTWQRFRAARGLPTFGRIGNGGPAPSKWATRLWWQLKSQGFDRVSVLEEGFLGWRSAGHPVAEGVETAEPVTVDTTPLDGWFVDTPEVFAATTSADVTLLDSRERDRYVAERKMSYRPGHIPTARHLALGETLAPGSAALKPLAELRATFATRLPEDGRVITYCGGGVSASWNAFALYVSGRRDIAVYDGSMGEWGRTNHPLIIGDETAG
jgi:thiosulfate/3-mercaptopyruvate sulfurtransferase